MRATWIAALSALCVGCSGSVAVDYAGDAGTDATSALDAPACATWGTACRSASDCCPEHGLADAGLEILCYEGRCAFSCDEQPAQIECATIGVARARCSPDDAGALVCHFFQ